MRKITGIVLVALAVAAAACTVKDTPTPDLTGPSELGLRLNVQAVPDTILQDGFSQTVINIDASSVDGRPARGLPLRVEVTYNGVIQDFGTLSSKNVVTGDDGRARVIYTAPPRPATSSDSVTVVSIHVTPIGSDFSNAVPRLVDIRLIPPGVILPPNDAPVPLFTFTPTSPQILTTVTFDASRTTDEGVTCGPNCSYAWDFGDGSSGEGIFATHQYRSVGTYQVRLTATDGRGASGQTAQTLTVGAGTPPTVSFTMSPTAPAVNEQVLFNATNSTAASGRRIVSYDWNFGNGRTGSGVTASTSYGAVGTYNVSLTVTDDAGQKATVSNSVTVSATGALTAALTVSPTGGNTSTTFFFDASASRPGPSAIVEYRFTFGDTSPDVVGSSPTTTHKFLLPGSYVVRVTIRDSANRTATATVNVTVQ